MKYTCYACNQEFEGVNPESSVWAEYKELFPGSAAQGVDTVRVCDTCFKKVMSWWNGLTPEERVAARQQFESEGEA